MPAAVGVAAFAGLGAGLLLDRRPGFKPAATARHYVVARAADVFHRPPPA